MAALKQIPGVVRVGEIQIVGNAARLAAIHSMKPRTPEGEELIHKIRELPAPEGTLVGGIAADYTDTQGAISSTMLIELLCAMKKGKSLMATKLLQ